MDLDDKQVITELTRMCLEQATQQIAEFARRMADDDAIRGLTSKEVMLAFATAIENTNAKVWQKSKARA